MSKLCFYKCAQFLLFLCLSTFFIHHFHSYTKILTMIPLIHTPYSPHSHPDSLHSHHSPHFIPRFPIPAFKGSHAKTNFPKKTAIVFLVTVYLKHVFFDYPWEKKLEWSFLNEVSWWSRYFKIIIQKKREIKKFEGLVIP